MAASGVAVDVGFENIGNSTEMLSFRDLESGVTVIKGSPVLTGLVAGVVAAIGWNYFKKKRS